MRTQGQIPREQNKIQLKSLFKMQTNNMNTAYRTFKISETTSVTIDLRLTIKFQVVNTSLKEMV